MKPGGLRLYARALTWTLSCAGGGYLLLEVWLRGPALLSSIAPAVALLLPACLAAHLASRREDRRLPRLSLAFILAALLLLPPPGALLIGGLACLAGLGAGVLGPRRRGAVPFAVTVVALGSAQALDPFVALPGHPGAWFGLGGAALLFLFVEAFALALTLLLAAAANQPGRAPERPAWRAMALEGVTVPLAWMLAETLARQAWIEVCVVSAIVLAGEITLLVLSRTVLALRDSNRSLASRIGELDTLHAMGREILSSLEPTRVCAIVERECRKIFPMDYCLIALADVESARLRAVYRRERGRPALTDERQLEGGLSPRVAEAKRSLRVDELRRRDMDVLLRREPDAPRLLSAIAVPLIVEDRVIGVLSLYSTNPAAYDDHHVSVLTTVAQQAAVAIENARSYQSATVDSLTGFFLRDHFFRRLEEEHRRVGRYGGTFSLLMMDLDGFKEINDRHGHPAGDQYLRAVAATIRAELRAADLPCRYGGDEFCLLLPETELRGASAIAERIRVAVAREIVGVEGVALRATASIGVAVHPRHGARDVADLLRHADEALYRAKRAGRDCVVPYAA